MGSIKQVFRLLKINYVLAKNGLDQLIVSIHLFSAFRFIIYLNPWNWFRKEPLSRGVALRKSLEELGPIFVKFGQALSTRPDILPPDVAFQLNKLQDNVEPFSSEKVLQIIENTFGLSAHEVFANFDETPLASASIAQVHAAKLKTGEDVVVKVLRPDIHKVIAKDIKILKTIAKFADKYSAFARRLKPNEVVSEFEKSILNELNLNIEAANGSQLRRNFKNSELLYIPEIYWDYVSDNILVMERIYGIPVASIDQLVQHNINLKSLAERGLEIFFQQVFRDCFFHADMHPGNIFVSPTNPQNPQYLCVDFGIIGTLNDNDKRYLAENLLAFFYRDYRKIAKLHIESGWVKNNTREDEFENAIRTVCEPIFEKPLKDISFALIILNLFQVAKRFEMQVQPQLALLQKTLFAVEGLGRQIYPDLNLWVTAKPFLEKWVKDQVGAKAFIRNLKENIPFITEQLPFMPRLFNDVLLQLKENKDYVKKSQERMSFRSSKKWLSGLGSGVFISSAGIAVISYFNVIDYGNFINISLGISLLGGLLAVFTRKN
ncbi:MAG: ubiquinone biosynthesis regulatory protein kinase UbiB [Legionellales bacterium RIFCSPHIGHO2_12_FULL_35_11]|nr:MAG: ubiquinone biosynthesis regulatory protein kinase UbiB [Legionellales bacterium RIFCSPHIGHO2_12_FULL_35_11]